MNFYGINPSENTIMKTLKKYLKLYFVDAMGSMALGLFASLLIGTIFGAVGDLFYGADSTNDIFTKIAGYCQGAAGMAIGVAIAHKLKADPLVLFSCAAVGSIGYSLPTYFSAMDRNLTAGPAGSFFAVIVAAEIGMLVSKKTKVDIIVTPVVTIFTGFAVSWLICPGIAYVMYWLGTFINTATTYQPFLMGVIISVVVGMILTLPISSAAICAMIGIAGIAGGAAAVGCCAQMVGFAVISFKENKWGGIVSQGLGTSMLQMGNIVKNPRIWIPPTLAAAICGPVSTMIFKLKCNGVSSGMGTCGLVGPIGIFTASGNSAMTWIGIILCCFVLPAALSLLFSFILKKIGWIKDGDMLLTE